MKMPVTTVSPVGTPNLLPIRILVVEDSRSDFAMLERGLQRDKDTTYDVTWTRNGADAKQCIDTQAVDILIIDHNLPDTTGLELFATIENPLLQFGSVLITGNDTDNVPAEALKLGVDHYLFKDTQGNYLNLLPYVVKRAYASFRERKMLEDKAQQLAALNAELDDFAKTVAHEVKAPLTHITANADLVLMDFEDELPAMVIKSINSMRKHAYSIRNIVDDLLLLSSTNEVEVPIEPLDMHAIVMSAIEVHEPLIQRTQARVHVPASFRAAKGYAPWVQKIWENYISNAAKYGGLRVNIQLSSQDLGNGLIRYTVTDNGPGISASNQTKLFIPFSRLHRSRARGHGLGLSIVDRITQRLGGKVGLDSDEGAGTTFWFTLPSSQE